MLKLRAYAKLDLAIDINPKKLSDGFLPVHYVVTQMELSDELIFEAQKGVIKVVCRVPELSREKDNFVYKVAMALRNIVGRGDLGVKITLLKNIPIRAGFGGGSSDGAAALLGLSKLWKVKVSQGQIRLLSRELGKDFFYSIYGGLCEVLGEGKSYKLVPIAGVLPTFWLLVVVPDEKKPSTGWVYRHLRDKNLGCNFDRIVKLKTAIKKCDRAAILKNLTNDFEDTVSSYYPVISQMKYDLVKNGARAAIMAGAGLSVVGFFDSRRAANAAKKGIGEKYAQSLVAKTVS